MVYAAGNIEADDLAPRVNTEDPGQCGAREIDGLICGPAQQETVVKTPAIDVPPNDVALRINTESQSGRRAWNIDGGEYAVVE